MVRSWIDLVGGFCLGIWFASVYVYNTTISKPSKSKENEFQAKKRKAFTELLIESGSDKYSRHHYERYYSRWLAPYREKRGLKFLEIGANEGHSLNLWAEYFDREPDIIVGLAYGDGEGIVRAGNFTPTGNGKVVVIEGDQSSKKTMLQLSEMGPWDVIIDDGSHVPQHVLISLFSLWPTIKPGGMYVIEDIETSYWRPGSDLYGYKLKGTGFLSDSNHSVVYKLKEILDTLARHQLGRSDISVMPEDESLCSMEWGMNLVALKKCGPDDGENPPVRKRNFLDLHNLEEWLEQVAQSAPECCLIRADVSL